MSGKGATVAVRYAGPCRECRKRVQTTLVTTKRQSAPWVYVRCRDDDCRTITRTEEAETQPKGVPEPHP